MRRSIAQQVDITQDWINQFNELGSSHKLVQQTLLCLKDVEPRENGLLFPRGNNYLDVYASEATMKRALMLMNSLIVTLESHGYKVVTGNGKRFTTIAHVEGEEIEIGIRELTYGRKHQISKGENKLMEGGNYKPPEWDSVRTGKLQFQIHDISGIRGKWSDCLRHKLEDCIDRFIDGIKKAAQHLKDERREREEWQRKCEEDRRLREEAENRRQEEMRRFNALRGDAANWCESKRIREYLDALRTAYLQKHGTIEPDSKTDRYLKWGYSVADLLDPLVNI